jgi:hypothetical protein
VFLNRIGFNAGAVPLEGASGATRLPLPTDHAIRGHAVVSLGVTLLPLASTGLGGLLGGGAAAPALGLAGLAATALFVAIIGGLLRADASAEQGDDWAPGIGRRGAAICAAAFTLVAALSAGLAWAVWAMQGPARAIGLAATALGFGSAALAFGRRALRRR